MVGTDHPKAVISTEDVKLMRALYDEGVRIVDIARKFEASYFTVRGIVQRVTRIYE